ncbi:AraC family transcriptional regulator [Dyadobacter sp. CY312]|uniref:helix-turn-helix domain-containing protein n=1 Tax=Dyadobacter sp. CY312 TaxID=2907303 RepID=UPI001F1ED50E|nr:AraC family transcriptional regulator [Dyadobacter sp. CY312]MCE7044504.1 AraC family transcriptional regulator [Dyadobacter sp. CY312]
MDSSLHYQFALPEKSLDDFVESFWMLTNHSDTEKHAVILPDGRVDLFLSRSTSEPFHVTLLGIGTLPEQASIPPGSVTFAISFKLPGAEYILKSPIAHLLDKAENQPSGFWGFDENDLHDFEAFCQKATQRLKTEIPQEIDTRKLKLFQLIYHSKGALSVKELSENVYWSSRQINRYFNQQFGLPLKSYCNILRFRASFQHIKNGKLFPEGKFSDQSHFIREIKKLSGVLPKDLSLNQNDRFIQFSTIPEK